jgi:hypothetical protein
MPSKQLMGTWIALDVCLLAAGALSIAFSIIWQTPDLVRSLVISKQDLLGKFPPFAVPVDVPVAMPGVTPHFLHPSILLSFHRSTCDARHMFHSTAAWSLIHTAD